MLVKADDIRLTAMICQVCDLDKKEAKRALNGAKCDQNDGNLLRPARFRRGTAEQCFAPDSRISLAAHSAVLILCANITSSASGFNSTSATPKEKDDESAKQRSHRLWWSRRELNPCPKTS